MALINAKDARRGLRAFESVGEHTPTLISKGTVTQSFNAATLGPQIRPLHAKPSIVKVDGKWCTRLPARQFWAITRQRESRCQFENLPLGVVPEPGPSCSVFFTKTSLDVREQHRRREIQPNATRGPDMVHPYPPARVPPKARRNSCR